MMIKYKYLALVNIFSTILLVFIGINSINAQSTKYHTLLKELEKIEDSINTFQGELDELQKQFALLNSEIFELKTELRINNNLIKKIKLEGKLKESSKYTNRIKKIIIKLEGLNNRRKRNYQKIIEDINYKVNLAITKFNSTNNSSVKSSIIENVNRYENEKKKYYKRLNQKIPTVLEDSSIEINSNDNLDRLNLKVALIKDRLTFLEEERKYIFKKKEELNSDLSMYIEMSDFIRALRRNIDDEQEFYDPSRAEQIYQNIKDIKNKLKSLKERLAYINKSETYYKLKLERFNIYIKSLLSN